MLITIELVVAVAIILALFGLGRDILRQGEEAARADRIAAVVSSVHDAAERYIRDEYVALEDCFDAVGESAAWLAETGTKAGAFRAVPLYRLAPGAGDWPASGHVQFLGEEPCAGGAAYPRSLAAAGLLPVALERLVYDDRIGNEDSNLWSRDAIDFRLIARLVDLDPNLGRPALAIQAFLVVSSRPGQAMDLVFVNAVVSASQLGSLGMVPSIARGGSIAANRTIAGVEGGWRAVVCGTVAGAGVSVCPATGTGVGEVPETTVLEVSDATEPVFLAFRSESGAETVAGALAVDGPKARVVAAVRHTRESFLANVLHARDIGIDEANRVSTDIDMGGQGFVNAAFVTGVDSDGDGVVDQDLHVFGPHDTAGNPSGEVLVHGNFRTTGTGTFDGGLTVNGPVVINGTLTVRDDITGASDLLVAGNAAAGGALRVGASAIDVDQVAGDVLVGRELRVGGGMAVVGPNVRLAADSTAGGNTWSGIAARVAIPASDSVIGFRVGATGSANRIVQLTRTASGVRLRTPVAGEEFLVDSLGDLALGAGEDISLQAGVGISVDAEEDIAVQAGEGISFDAEEDIAVTAVKDISLVPGTGTDDQILFDPDKVWMHDDDRLADRSLGDALPRYAHEKVEMLTGTDLVPPAPVAPTCEHGTAVRFAVPVGWNRQDYARTRTISITLGGTTQSFDIYDGYTGWVVNPTTGVDEGTPAPSLTGGGTVNISYVWYCDMSSP